MALSTIVIAVLVLLVLLVLGLILTKQTGNFQTNVNSCEQKNGACMAETSDCAVPAKQFVCPDVASIKQKCCLVK